MVLVELEPDDMDHNIMESPSFIHSTAEFITTAFGIQEEQIPNLEFVLIFILSLIVVLLIVLAVTMLYGMYWIDRDINTVIVAREKKRDECHTKETQTQINGEKL